MSELKSIYPVNGELVGSYPELNSVEIDSIISKVSSAFNTWRRLVIQDRCQYFKNISEILRARQNEFARIMALEMGKPLKQGKSEVEKSAFACMYYADIGPELLKNKPVKTEFSESYINFQPLGIILGAILISLTLIISQT